MKRTPRRIPEGNRHNLWRGKGPARRAGGLQLAGVVLKAFRPDDNPDREGFVESRITGWLCQVLVYSSRGRAVIDNVPVAVHRLGLNGAALWEPKATTVDVTGGELVLEAENGKTPTPPHHMDGDHVLVSFLDDDLNQPLITACLPHPKSYRRPSSNNDLYASEVWARGNHLFVSDDGDVEVDTTAASDGTQGVDGSLQSTPGKGNVTVKLKSSAKVRIEIDGSNTVIEANNGKVTIKADAVEINDPTAAQGVARIGDAVQSHNHGPIAFSLTADLTTGLVTGTITAASQSPEIVEGSGTVRAGD